MMGVPEMLDAAARHIGEAGKLLDNIPGPYLARVEAIDGTGEINGLTAAKLMTLAEDIQAELETQAA